MRNEISSPADVGAVFTLSDISRAIQAKHVSTPLWRASFVEPGDSLSDALRRMHEGQFDSLPVMRGGVPVGLVGATELTSQGEVELAMRPLDAKMLISSDTELVDLCTFLSEEPFLFVVHGRTISGFVTPSDMGKAPARTHFYLLLAALEMRLAEFVRRRYPDQDQAIALLSESRQQKYEDIAADLRSQDQFVDPVAAVSLMDLVTIAGQTGAYRDLVARAGYGWRSATGGLALFRNDVMHPVRDFAKATPEGMADLASYDRRLSTLLGAAEEVLSG